MAYFILFLDSKEDKRKKGQEKYVAQQRVYLTKKKEFF